MSIIFAVTKSLEGPYNQLKDSIYGSQTGILENDSSNVIKFVEEEYDVIKYFR